MEFSLSLPASFTILKSDTPSDQDYQELNQLTSTVGSAQLIETSTLDMALNGKPLRIWCKTMRLLTQEIKIFLILILKCVVKSRTGHHPAKFCPAGACKWHCVLVEIKLHHQARLFSLGKLFVLYQCSSMLCCFSFRKSQEGDIKKTRGLLYGL